MSDISTTYDNDVLVLGDAHIVLGTCMLGDDFGQIESASVKRTGDIEKIMNCQGNLRAVIVQNPGFQMTLESIFNDDVDAPGIFDIVNIPLIDINGRVMPGATIKWTKGKERMLSFDVECWDALADAVAYKLSSAGVFTSLDAP